MSELDALISRAVALSDKVDFWNSLVLWSLFVTAIAAGAIVFCQRMATVRAKQLSGVQDTIVKIKDDDLEKQKGVVAQLQINAARQEERAAIAERKYLELQERIQWRTLDEKQSARFVAALKNLSGATVDVGYTSGGGDEALSLVEQLIRLFKEANWTVRDDQSIIDHLDIEFSGAAVVVRGPTGDQEKLAPGYAPMTETLKTIREAFKAADLHLEVMNYHPGENMMLEIVIGSKPQAPTK